MAIELTKEGIAVFFSPVSQVRDEVFTSSRVLTDLGVAAHDDTSDLR
jgi:hypothetical protein